MSPELSGILIGIGSIAGATLLALFAGAQVRLMHTPKRLDRIETILPPLLRAMLAVLKCQREGKCNGMTDDAIQELEELMTNGIISRKAKA